MSSTSRKHSPPQPESTKRSSSCNSKSTESSSELEALSRRQTSSSIQSASFPNSKSLSYSSVTSSRSGSSSGSRYLRNSCDSDSGMHCGCTALPLSDSFYERFPWYCSWAELCVGVMSP
jgi:hypothetical protein